MSEPSAHAKLQPSSAKRWLTCPGSVELESTCVDAGSDYAEEGTAGHEVFASLVNGGAPDPWLGKKASNGVEITREILDLVIPAAEWVHEYKKEHKAVIFSEVRMEIGAHAFGLQPGLMFGTSDIVGLSDELLVDDLKLGYVDVPVKENPQLITYALGALYHTGWVHDRVRLVIQQPRTSDEPKQIVYTATEIEAFRLEYLPKAITAVQGGPLVPSEDGCRYCKAAGVCPRLREETLALARREFSNVLTLSGPEIADLLDKGTMIENALKSLRSHALKLLEIDPESVPGYKRVQGEKKRAWVKSEEEIKTALDRLHLGLTSEDWYERSLRSPAQVEGRISDKLIEKAKLDAEKLTKKKAKEDAKKLLADLAKKPDGEPTLVKISDERQALGPAFTAADVAAADAVVEVVKEEDLIT